MRGLTEVHHRWLVGAEAALLLLPVFTQVVLAAGTVELVLLSADPGGRLLAGGAYALALAAPAAALWLVATFIAGGRAALRGAGRASWWLAWLGGAAALAAYVAWWRPSGVLWQDAVDVVALRHAATFGLAAFVPLAHLGWLRRQD